MDLEVLLKGGEGFEFSFNFHIFEEMMTNEHIKEAISIRYLQLIAAYSGYTTTSTHPDYGTDLDIKEIGFRSENGRSRYLETGRELKIQVKATTEKAVNYQDGQLMYDLNATTYNDLVMRKSTRAPLILVVFILPEEPSTWVSVSDNELICKKCAYWYIPLENEPTGYTSTFRVTISMSNLISTESLNRLFEDYA